MTDGANRMRACVVDRLNPGDQVAFRDISVTFGAFTVERVNPPVALVPSPGRGADKVAGRAP